MKHSLTVAVGLVAGLVVVSSGASSAAQRSQLKSQSAKPDVRKVYAPPRTAWGDPDLQGIYTNKDESGIPFERPNELAGKSIQDVDDQELAELVKERQQQTTARAAGIGGADTGAGPIHWYENYGAKN